MLLLSPSLGLLLFDLSVTVLSFLDLLEDVHGDIHIDLVVLDEISDGFPHIMDLGHLHQHWHVFIEHSIRHVVVPTQDWKAALRLQHV